MKDDRSKSKQKAEKELQIISRCYDCFVETGLESITIRDLATAADVNINTLYYHFNSKSGILIKCTDYGFAMLEEQIFDALNKLDQSSYDVFPGLLKVGIDNAPQIRFLLQAVASPTLYGYREAQKNRIPSSDSFYNRLGDGIAEKFGCPYELIKNYIYEIMTLLSFFSLWGSSEMASLQFNRIFTDFKSAILNYRKRREGMK